MGWADGFTGRTGSLYNKQHSEGMQIGSARGDANTG